MRIRRPITRCSGLGLVEILVVAGILIVLAALLFPAIQGAARRSKQIKCLGNLRSYGIALQTYASENRGLPWWDGLSSSLQTDGSTYPNFEAWVRPYLHQTLGKRLRCPIANAAQLKSKAPFNYNGNSALCIYYPKLLGLPVPSSRVVFAAEIYSYEGGFNHPVHFNMTMWDLGESAASGGADSFAGNEGTEAQYHGTPIRRGLNLFFLDGHAETVFPPKNDWRESPVYGDATNGGYFYSKAQFRGFSK